MKPYYEHAGITIIGIEIEERYWIAARRLQQEVLPLVASEERVCR